ncbi:2325_t:CDS:1, partial [Funneliformis geosporum]
INQIKAKMEENKRKAMNEKDPRKRAALLLEIEEDGKLLQQKYREHQEHSNKFRFNPEEYVSGLVEGMKKAIERNNPDGGGNGGGSPNRPNRPNDPDNNDPFGGLGGDGNTDPDPNRLPRPRKPSQAENNQQLIIFAVVAAVFIFILMNQKEKPQQRDYEEDYY